jgi:hypothetical protein
MPDAIPSVARTTPPDAPAPPALEAGGGPTDFGEVLRGLAREIARGERVLEQSLRTAHQLDAAQLIALQAGIYRFSEAVDLVAKVVDRAGQAVRTTLSGSGG